MTVGTLPALSLVASPAVAMPLNQMNTASSVTMTAGSTCVNQEHAVQAAQQQLNDAEKREQMIIAQLEALKKNLEQDRDAMVQAQNLLKEATEQAQQNAKALADAQDQAQARAMEQKARLDALEAAEKQKADELAELKRKQAQAQKEEAQLPSADKEAAKDIEGLKAQVQQLEQEKAALGERYDQASHTVDEQREVVKAAESNSQQAQQKLQEATQKAQMAESQLEELKKALAELPDSVDDTVADIDSAVHAKEQELAQAQDVRDKAAEDMAKYEQEANDALAQLETAQQNLAMATQQRDALAAEAAQKQKAVEQAQAQVRTADDALAAAKAHQKQVSDQIQTNEKIVSDEPTRNQLRDQMLADTIKAEGIDQAEKNARSAWTQYQQAKQEKEDAQKKFDAKQADYKKGVKGFFESQGDQGKEALKVLDGTSELWKDKAEKSYEIDGKTVKESFDTFRGHTKVGAQGDATSLENVEEALNLLKRANKYRQQEKVAPLMISDEMLALAQVQSNAFTKIFNDNPRAGSDVQNNTFKAPRVNDKTGKNNDPFWSWYTEGKKATDESADKDRKARYDRLMSSEMKVSGFGVAGNLSDGTSTIIFTQLFSKENPGNGQNGVSVEEYSKKFDAYYQVFKDLKKNLDDANSRFKAAEKAYGLAQMKLVDGSNKLEQTRKNFEKKLQDIKAESERLKKQLEGDIAAQVKQAEDNRVKLQDPLTHLEEEREQLQSLLKQKEQDVLTAETHVKNVDGDIEPLWDSHDKAEERFAQAHDTVTAVGAEVEALKDALAVLKRLGLGDSGQTLQQSLDAHEKAVADAKREREEWTAKQKAAQDNLEKSRNGFKNAVENADRLGAGRVNTSVRLSGKEAALSRAQKAADVLKRLDDLGKQIGNVEQVLKDKRAQISQAEQALTKLEEELKQAASAAAKALGTAGAFENQDFQAAWTNGLPKNLPAELAEFAKQFQALRDKDAARRALMAQADKHRADLAELKSEQTKLETALAMAKAGLAGCMNQKTPGEEPKPGEKPADQPGVKPGQTPSPEGPGTKPDKMPGDTPGEMPSDKPDKMPGNQPGEMPGMKPDVMPGDKPSETPGEMPGTKPDVMPGDTPGEKPSDQPSEMPGGKLDAMPDQNPGEMPSNKPEVMPGGRTDETGGMGHSTQPGGRHAGPADQTQGLSKDGNGKHAAPNMEDSHRVQEKHPLVHTSPDPITLSNTGSDAAMLVGASFLIGAGGLVMLRRRHR